MDFLKIDVVKQNCRIEEYSKDSKKQREIDNTIKKCANIAEGLVYDYIGKDYFAIMKEYGEIPVSIRHAALMAASDMILYCSPDPTENSVFKLLLKPFKKK